MWEKKLTNEEVKLVPLLATQMWIKEKKNKKRIISSNLIEKPLLFNGNYLIKQKTKETTINKKINYLEKHFSLSANKNILQNFKVIKLYTTVDRNPIERTPIWQDKVPYYKENEAKISNFSEIHNNKHLRDITKELTFLEK